MKKRRKKVITAAIVLFAAAVLYYIINKITGFSIPCPIHFITGLYCPGCGISRMFIALFELDFYRAFRQNAMVFISLPLLLFLIIYSAIKYIKCGNMPNSKWFNVITVILICCYVLFGVLRNTEYFSFLAPI